MFGFKKAGQVIKDAQKDVAKKPKDEVAARRGQKNQAKK